MNGIFYVGAKGGDVSFVNGDGEITRTISLPSGQYAAASFQKLRHPGETVSFPGSMQWLSAKSVRIVHPGGRDSSANPSFRVSPAQRQAKQLQAMMQRSEALQRSAAKALRAAARARRDVPQLEHVKSVPVDAGEIPAT